jgi:hypothetical protein
MPTRRRKSPVPGAVPDDDAIATARLAATTGASALDILIAAAAALPPDTDVPSALVALGQRARELDELAHGSAAALGRRAAPLPPELEFEPELARVRPDVRDHELRGRLLFRQLLGRKSFFQVAAWAIAGVELRKSDALLLEHLGVNTQLLDPHIWPLAAARRIATRGAPLARVLAGGSAAMFTRNITAEPVGAFIRLLDETQAALDGGASLQGFLDAELRRGRRLPGFGRPVLGPDERVPHGLRLMRRHRRASGASVRLTRQMERVLLKAKGLRLNSAGLQGAVMRDLGFAADAAAAFCAIYFVVPLLAHFAFVRERGGMGAGR